MLLYDFVNYTVVVFDRNEYKIKLKAKSLSVKSINTINKLKYSNYISEVILTKNVCCSDDTLLVSTSLQFSW